MRTAGDVKRERRKVVEIGGVKGRTFQRSVQVSVQKKRGAGRKVRGDGDRREAREESS
jgi:hypothetical protein